MVCDEWSCHCASPIVVLNSYDLELLDLYIASSLEQSGFRLKKNEYKIVGTSPGVR